MVSIFLVSAIFLFVIGAVLGSFINVIIYRSLAEKPLKKKERWYKGRSRCDSCGKQIEWYDNIPLLSYFLLQGKCRHCHHPIGMNHLAVEVLVGSLFVWWFWAGSLFFKLTHSPFEILQPAFWLIVGILLLAIFLTDLSYYIIPDVIVGALTILVLAYRVILVLTGVMQTTDFLWAVGCALGGFVFLGSLWLGTKGKGMGLGDVKLMIPLGFLLGWPNMLAMLFLAFFLGGVLGIGLLLTGKKKLGQVVPFGPFLIVATWISLVAGDRLIAYYLSWIGL